MNLSQEQKKKEVCPKCGGNPTIKTAFYGRACYAVCASCCWEGDTRDIEISPTSALSHWYNKARSVI